MGQHPSFVHLRYFAAPDPEAEPGISFLISSVESGLEIVVRPDWKDAVNVKDQAYVELMMKHWIRATSADAPEILAELTEMSLGPLRAVEWGQITPEKRSALLDQVMAA